MERYRAFEVTLKDTTPDSISIELFQKMYTKEVEFAHPDGVPTLWADTVAGEDVLINTIRSGKSSGCERFPKRYAETTDLEVDGKLSLDGTKKVVEVTEDNMASFATLLKARPEGYDVTVEYLDALTYTDLKNFIRRYPELDAELNLSLSRAVLLEATKEYFGLGDVI